MDLYMVLEFWHKFLSFYHNSRVQQTNILLMATAALHNMQSGKNVHINTNNN